MSFFYAYCPSAKKKESNFLRLLLTSGNIDDRIFIGQDFYENIITELGINCQIVDCVVNICRSRYFSAYLSSTDWRDIWQIIYFFDFKLSEKISFPNLEPLCWGKGISLTSSDWKINPDDDENLDCLIICDFEGKEKLDYLEAILHKEKRINLLTKIDEPEFKVFRTNNNYYQVHYRVREVSTRFYQDGLNFLGDFFNEVQLKNITFNYVDMIL